ncbi:trna 2-phosphotransferase 1 protein [Diplodia corticola]|uniref:Trna 2-phosphotransferase 1 protein n=1 Tax=Diplodia corticola TaxID=236234 RepID=A0A1J9QVU8_9PEZI|nr:trna 2-phosphotransferase 1 protein [Diplodia corticola]OJD32122.1 trna 2-phosphotransferase 1 protein [Diplodia corticola]
MPQKRQPAPTTTTIPSDAATGTATATTTTAAPDDAAVRKRKQNRLSQQCLREKRSAGVANQSFFERLAADMRRLREVCERQAAAQAQSSSSSAGSVGGAAGGGAGGGLGGGSGGGGSGGGLEQVNVVAELVRINEGLVEENRCLREGVLRMRKKLLSLSGQASAAAEDPVFQKILGKESEAAEATAAPSKRRKCSSSAGSGSASGRAVGSASSDAEEPDRIEPVPIDEGDMFAHLPGEPSGSFNPLSSSAGFDNRLVTANQTDSLQLFPRHHTGPEICSAFTTTTRPPPDFQTGPNFSFSNLPQISLTNTAILDAWMSRSYANLLAQKVENVCVQYALKSRACKLDMGSHAFRHFDERTMVERLGEIAVHMIFDDTGLGRFINTLEGARDFVKSVMTCRIMIGCAKPHDLLPDEVDDTASPPWTTGTRPLIVDLIAWPSLRDQMVFHSSFYDLDEMTEDVVNYTVVDMPDQHLALQMYSTPPNPFPSACRPDEYDAVKPFRFAECEFTHKILQLPTQDLFDIIARRMDAPPPATTTDYCAGAGAAGAVYAHSDLLGSAPSECIPAKTTTSRTFTGYKLSGAFFKKYPFLQCSSLASPYPFLPSCKVATY